MVSHPTGILWQDDSCKNYVIMLYVVSHTNRSGALTFRVRAVGHGSNVYCNHSVSLFGGRALGFANPGSDPSLLLSTTRIEDALIKRKMGRSRGPAHFHLQVHVVLEKLCTFPGPHARVHSSSSVGLFRYLSAIPTRNISMIPAITTNKGIHEGYVSTTTPSLSLLTCTAHLMIRYDSTRSSSTSSSVNQ